MTHISSYCYKTAIRLVPNGSVVWRQDYQTVLQTGRGLILDVMGAGKTSWYHHGTYKRAGVGRARQSPIVYGQSRVFSLLLLPAVFDCLRRVFFYSLLPSTTVCMTAQEESTQSTTGRQIEKSLVRVRAAGVESTHGLSTLGQDTHQGYRRGGLWSYRPSSWTHHLVDHV